MSQSLSIEFLRCGSRVLRTLGHPDRLKIIEYLTAGEKSVGQIQRHLGINQPATSQHLRYMHSRGIVKFRREGTTYYYSIASQFIYMILDCMSDWQNKVQSENWALESMTLTTLEK